MTTDPADVRKTAIARLVSQGHLTQENPGQYVPDDVDAESRNGIPAYDADQVRKAMPEILQIDFDETDGEGCFALLRDGKTGESTKVPLGEDPPETTAKLIEVIQAHFRSLLDLDGINEANRALAELGGDDDDG